MAAEVQAEKLAFAVQGFLRARRGSGRGGGLGGTALAGIAARAVRVTEH